MKELLAIIICLTFALVFACNTTKGKTQTDTSTTSTTSDNTSSTDTLVVMSKGGCFGRCPIYTMTVYDKGRVVYEGKRFTKRLGQHEKQMDKEAYKNLKSALKAAELWQYPDKYEARIPDLPSTTIVYHEKGKQKSIFFKDKVDDPVKDLTLTMEDFAKDETGWTIVPGQELPSSYVANEFIIQLSEEVDANTFVKTYSDYDLQIKKQITPRGNYYSMTYDNSKLDSYTMLNKLAADKQVINVEFNKVTSMRGR